MSDANTPHRTDKDIGRILGPIAAVCTIVAVHTRNTEDTPQHPSRAIFKLVVHAGDERVERECDGLGCMGGPLRPGGSRTSTFQFVVTRPADSLEFVDTTNEISGRVARIRLRPTPS